MSAIFMNQDEYKSPVDEIFEIGIVDVADFSSLGTDFFSQYIGKEIDGPDGKQYIVHSVMKDVFTEKFYALCQELMQDGENNE